MEDQGPTWWQARQLRQPGMPLTKPEYSVLFEYFRSNALQYALLRVSITDGQVAQQATFSTDEIDFPSPSLTPTAFDISAPMRDAVDNLQEDLVDVQKHHQDSFFSVLIHIDSSNPPLRLSMKNSITLATFVDRIMVYLANVHADFHKEQKEVQTLLTKRDELRVAVNTAVKEKCQDDNNLIFTTKMLMEEKHRYNISK